ncbi:thermonuclease family protein [Methylobacterium sp. Leaf118]|uniref:thermonuclease family protein n=1 Tax=Methylobacterium sp. Leaf118 TaxID=2876562 RepID=UPI001E349FEC|nr:hypothetical protein [Methylobacterium sp. Leaf118]
MKGSAKAAGRSKEAAAPPPEAPVSEDDRRIRALILAELDRRRVRPVARRTLALIAEGFVEPAEGLPGYRIVDRAGTVRLRGEGAGVPLALHELIEELSGQHPALFEPPPPVPEPPEPHRDTIADVRAAGARFVETQSALARSLASTSAERSRALANAASETVEGWRHRLATRLRARPRPAPVAFEPAASDLPDSATPPPVTEGLRSRLDRTWTALSGRLQPRENALRLRDRVEDGLAAGGHRPVLLMGLGAVAGAGLVAAIVLTGREGGEPAATGRETPPVAETRTPPQESRDPSPAQERPPAQEPAPAETPRMPPAADPPAAEAPRAANTPAGVAEVIDTATLRVAGKVVRLFGVEWVRGGQADELAKYLRGREVTCQPAPGSSAHICTVEGRDLSEVVLFNGGGRASAEATPELAAAEDHARSERLGVWKR